MNKTKNETTSKYVEMIKIKRKENFFLSIGLVSIMF